MTTKEQWKLGILIAGMLVITLLENSGQVERHNVVPLSPPRVEPPPPPASPTPVATAPQYPIHKTIAIDQQGWCDEITCNEGEQVEWEILDENAWLDTRINRSAEFRQFPRNDDRWQPLKSETIARTLAFRITPGTPVETASLELTIEKGIGFSLFAREKRLSSATPSLAESGVKRGPKWPSELSPTRHGKLPPDGIANHPGEEASDTIYPIEDVVYRIAPGWEIYPYTDGGTPVFQAVHDPEGVRIRPLYPDNPILVKFKMTPIQNQNTASQPASHPPMGNQGASGWNPSPQPVTQPPSRPYVTPQQPSYYPTAPTGPSYYPSSTQPQRRKPNT